MTLTVRLTLLWVFSLSFYLTGNAAFIKLNKGELKDISAEITYFIDSSGTYTAESIVKLPSSRFQSSASGAFNQVTPYAIWLKISLDTTYSDTYLYFNNSTSDSILLYDGLNYLAQGEKIKFEDKRYATIFPLFHLPPNTQKGIFWIKIINPVKPTTIHIHLGDGGKIFRKANARILIMSGFFFLMLVVLIFNVVLYKIQKSSLVLTLGLFNLSTLFFIGFFSDLDVFLPFNISYYIKPYAVTFLCLLMLSGIVMSISILSIKKQFPTTFRILQGLFLLIVALAFLDLVGYTAIAAAVAGPLGGVIIPIYILTSYRAYRLGQKHALFFLIGWVLYYIVVVALVLMIYNIIPAGDYSIYLSPCVSVIDFFLIMATVISKLNQYREEKENSEKAQLQIINEQKRLLESRVIDRTRELQILNEEIATQNEELQSQQEHIIKLNDTLEKKVDLRTVELQTTLSSLQLRNKDLENFSYVVSHNLRGPVSTMIGLVQVFNTEDPADPSNRDVLQFLKRSVEGLDRVILDMNYIISIRKDGDEELKTISLLEEMKLSTGLLEKEISRSGATIETDFTKVDTLQSVPAYIQNIFYNLISNAIKYSKENVAPILKIKASIEGKECILTFSDNGIGMDLSELNAEKVFKMYQRFNDTIEGKGLGLYLVKSQVDMLKGSITVKSIIGKGTTFTIRLPL